MAQKSLIPASERLWILRNCPSEAQALGGGGLELKDEYAAKSLYICTREQFPTPPAGKYRPWDSSLAFRAINLRDLLTSSSSPVEFELRAQLADYDVPSSGGLGVLGSKIVFAGGLKLNFEMTDNYEYFETTYGPDMDISKEAYAFDIRDHKQGIVKMAGALNGFKKEPLMFEFAGKLYALCFRFRGVSFEVFDLEQGTWSVLPSFPDPGICESYAIAGTKLFMSTLHANGSIELGTHKPAIWSFDLAAQDPEWRSVPSMCQGGALPFEHQALVLDLPQPDHCNKKLVFSAEPDLYSTSLWVHVMSLDENQEDMSEILEVDLPAELLRFPSKCRLFHLGGNNVCVVGTRAGEEDEDHTVRGAALPFHFEFDISKVDTDRLNCLTVQLQPPRVFKYHTSGQPDIIGCVLL